MTNQDEVRDKFVRHSSGGCCLGCLDEIEVLNKVYRTQAARVAELEAEVKRLREVISDNRNDIESTAIRLTEALAPAKESKPESIEGMEDTIRVQKAHGLKFYCNHGKIDCPKCQPEGK